MPVQTRVYDFGALLTQGRTKALATGLFAPGVYSGLEHTIVSPSLLRLAPGNFMLPNGVLVSEPNDVDVAFATPGLPTDYTLVAEHGDVQAIGGSAVTYQLVTGLQPAYGAPSANALALLWIRHPGVANLADRMITHPPLMRNDYLLSLAKPPIEAITMPPPIQWQRTAGANITQTQVEYAVNSQHVGMRVANTAMSGNQTLVFSVPLLSTARRPFSVAIYADLPNLCSIAVTLRSFLGALVTVTPASVTGPLTGLDNTPIATLEFDPEADGVVDDDHRPMRLQFTVTCQATASIFFSRAVVQYDV